MLQWDFFVSPLKRQSDCTTEASRKLLRDLQNHARFTACEWFPVFPTEFGLQIWWGRTLDDYLRLSDRHFENFEFKVDFGDDEIDRSVSRFSILQN